MHENAPEIPLSDVAWLTRLARTLTRDEDRAADLAQDAWLIAYESPPPSGEVNRPWLVRVLQRRHLRSIRTKERRDRRELVASRPEGSAATSDLVERTELQKKLSSALLELPEPHRTTLMRIAFDGQSSSQIASAEGVSVAVVRRRVRKARELLKQELVSSYGDDWNQWHASLLPIAATALPTDQLTTMAAAKAGLGTSIAVGGILVSAKFIAASVAVFAIAAWFIGARYLEDDDPILLGGGGKEVRQEAQRTQAVRANPESTLEVPAKAATTSEPADGPAGEEVPEQSATVSVSGTLVMRDHLGNEFRDAKGKIEGWYTKGGNFEIEVHEGRWRHDFERDEPFRLSGSATLSGRPALLDQGEEIAPLADDAEFMITGGWLPPSTLNVLDSDTREHLTDLKIVEVNLLLGVSHPGNYKSESVVAEGADSPVTFFPKTSYKLGYFVYRRGYGWNKVILDVRSGGEQELLLQEGEADLAVRVTGPGASKANVTLMPSGSVFADSSVSMREGDRVKIEGLRPGAYKVFARVQNPDAAVSEEVQVEVGMNEVVLELPAVSMVPVAGTLIMPRAWVPDAPELRLSLVRSAPWLGGGQIKSKRIALAQMEQVIGTEDTWRFDAGMLNPGSYRVEIRICGYCREIEIGPEGDTSLLVEISEPSVAEIALVDGTTRLGVPSDRVELQWQPSSLRSTTATYYPRPEYDEATNSWRVRGLLEDIQLRVRAPGYAPCELTLSAEDRDRRVEIRLEPVSYLGIEFVDGDEVLVKSPVWQSKVKVESDGRDRVLERGYTSDFGLVLTIRGSGLVDLSFPKIEGYRAIPGAQIRLTAGDVLRHRVRLVRE